MVLRLTNLYQNIMSIALPMHTVLPFKHSYALLSSAVVNLSSFKLILFPLLESWWFNLEQTHNLK